MTGNPTTPLPAVRVLWRPEQFNRVTNGTFETNTTGWSVSAGINAAGTSVTRITTDFHSGSACASVICTSTDTSGVNFDMGSNRFYAEASYGAMYAAVVWLKRVSGSRRARVTLGSEGTTTDRATLTITDLTDQWQPYVIRWLPASNRTDVQLAVTNGSAEALTFRIDDVAVYLVDAFSQCENGAFPVDTTGWDTSGAVIAAASTSLTFSSADGFAATGPTCAELVTTSTAGSGASFSMSGRTFLTGRTYRLRAAIKRVSGGGACTLRLGSIGTGADRGSSIVALTTSWEWYTVDWSPSADRTDVALAISNSTSSGAVVTMRISEVEVYESADDLGTDAGDMTWTRSLDGVGTIAVDVENADGRYDPRYSSSPLYGSVAPGKRIWGRATYSNALYPLFYGTLTTIEAAPLGGIHATLLAEDMLGALRDADVQMDFGPTDTYQYARSDALTGVVRAEPDSSGLGSLMASRRDLASGGPEAIPFYNGTDGPVPALDYLATLNEATQSVHWIAPSVHANIGWQYLTQTRATYSDTSSDFTVDESDPPSDMTGIRNTHETLENRQDVPWQSFTVLPPPGSDPDGYGSVMLAYDPTVYAGGFDADAPYLTYTDEEYGTDDGHPDVRWRWGGIGEKAWRKRRKQGKKVPRRTRVYPDAFVPFNMAAGEVRRYVLDFAIPVSNLEVVLDGTAGAADIVVDYIERTPNRLVVELRAIAADNVDWVAVVGTPWVPGDELNERVTAFDSGLANGLRSGPTFSTPYIPAPGLAAGVGAYRNWRFNAPRLRPQLYDRNNFPRTLTADLTDHFTVTADRYRVSSVLFASVGCRWEVAAGGLDWAVYHDLEELPDHDDWFILDSSALDGSDVLAH